MPAEARARAEKEKERILRRLSARGGHIRQLSEGCFGVFTNHGGAKTPLMKVKRARLDSLLAENLVVHDAEKDSYILSPAGHGWHRRRAVRADDPFVAQHQIRGIRLVEGEGGFKKRRVNLSESPLSWLYHRRGPDGKSFIERRHFEAGERLRRDFTRARLMPHMTANWQLLLQGGQRGGSVSGIEDARADLFEARKRFRAALEHLGKGLYEIAVEVCCHMRSLDHAERTLGLPKRAGKVVLRIALERLGNFYGLS